MSALRGRGVRVQIADRDMQAVARLWYELQEFPAAEADQALEHLQRSLIRLLGAVNVMWIGATRSDTPRRGDQLRGWIPHRIHWLYDGDVHARHWPAVRSRYEQGVADLQTAAMVAHGGATRTCLRPELVDDASWDRSWLVQEVLRPIGVGDRMLSACTVTAQAEAFLAFDREPRDAPFGEREQALCQLFMLGSTAIHREQMLLHGHLEARVPLTPRERSVLRLLLTDRTEAEIARELRLSWATTHQHVGAIFRKFGVRGRAGLLAAWLRCPPSTVTIELPEARRWA